MIPKKIHYCWFGGKPKPELAEKCIKSWKEKLPEYELIEWNEENFDIEENIYCKEAYQSRKWAFVTDYVRLKVLYQFGGIYMDTDVEVLGSLDEFLTCSAFSGFESNCSVPTGIMACEQGHSFFRELLDYYNDKHFIKEDGSFDMTTNVETITGIAERHGLKVDGSMQIVAGMHFYPKDYFCPMEWRSRELILTENTKTIHHFAGSWMSIEDRKGQKRYMLAKKILGRRLADFILETKKKIAGRRGK